VDKLPLKRILRGKNLYKCNGVAKGDYNLSVGNHYYARGWGVSLYFILLF